MAQTFEFLAALFLVQAGTSALGLRCKITVDPKDPVKGVFSNKTIKLKCDTFGELVDSFLWTKHNVQITNVSALNTSSTLAVSATNKIDRQLYKCTVRKRQAARNCFFDLTVNVFGPPVIKKFPNPNIDFYEDENITWSCHVTDGWPTPMLEWRVNGKAPDKVQPPFHVVQPHSSELVLKKDPTTGMEESRLKFECKCTAINDFGTTFRVVNIFLHEVLQSIFPNVTTESQRVFSYEGENVTLTCEERVLCKANQFPTITWFHDNNDTGEKQDDDETDRQCDNIGKYIFHLTRTDVTLKDQGKYRCKVEAEDGTDSKTIELVIVHEGFLNVTSEPSHVRVQLGENVTLNCLTTYPDVVTLGEFWTLNGTPLQTNGIRYTKGNPTVILDQNSTQSETENEAKFQGTKVKFSLTIHNVTQGDLGLYECGVNTTLGIEKASIQLRVTSSPQLTKAPDKSNMELKLFHIVLITAGAILTLALIIAMSKKYYHQYREILSPDEGSLSLPLTLNS